MGTKGEQTKRQILDSAQNLILQKGYSGTSLDEIIEGAGITKGGFFYHFDGRQDLAVELLVRYLQDDDNILRDLIEKSKKYVDDPLQRVLIFLKLYAEVIEQMEQVHPGCLVATYTYESQQFDPEILQMIRDGVASWKKHYLSLLEPAAQKYKLKASLTPETLADMLNTVLEGGIILTKIKGRNDFLVEQIKNYLVFVEFAFENP